MKPENVAPKTAAHEVALPPARRGRTARRKRNQRKPSATTARRTVTTQELLIELERLQHRAVVLDQLADEAEYLFGGNVGRPPKFLVGVEEGMAVRARSEVVFTIQCELRRVADLARAQIRERLEMRMSAPTEAATPVITEGVPQPEYFVDEEGEKGPSTLLATSVFNPIGGPRDRLR